MTTKKLLVETLNQLSQYDFLEFKYLLEARKALPPTPRKKLKIANTHDVVELMMVMYKHQCVEVTREVLRTMSRTDLAQRLSSADSESKGKATKMPIYKGQHYIVQNI